MKKPQPPETLVVCEACGRKSDACRCLGRRLACFFRGIHARLAGMFTRQYVRIEMKTNAGEQSVHITVEGKNVKDAYEAFLLAEAYANSGVIADDRRA